MSAAPAPISDMLVTVKSREIQRGMLAAMQKDARAARRHFLAAADLELVLADAYDQAGQEVLALRERSGLEYARLYRHFAHRFILAGEKQ